MGFLLDSASCVAAGRFNPAILMPEWVVKQGVLPNTEVEMASTMGSGITSFTMSGVEWRANLARLEAMAAQEGADPGEFVARVLERLEHTPMRAVGSNFHFSVTFPEQHPKLYGLAEFGLVKVLESEKRSFISGAAVADLSYEDAVLKVSLGFEKAAVTVIDLNFNRDSLTATDAAIAARLWSSDKEEAYKIVRKLIGD